MQCSRNVCSCRSQEKCVHYILNAILMLQCYTYLFWLIFAVKYLAHLSRWFVNGIITSWLGQYFVLCYSYRWSESEWFDTIHWFLVLAEMIGIAALVNNSFYCVLLSNALSVYYCNKKHQFAAVYSLCRCFF